MTIERKDKKLRCLSECADENSNIDIDFLSWELQQQWRWNLLQVQSYSRLNHFQWSKMFRSFRNGKKATRILLLNLQTFSRLLLWNFGIQEFWTSVSTKVWIKSLCRRTETVRSFIPHTVLHPAAFFIINIFRRTVKYSETTESETRLKRTS